MQSNSTAARIWKSVSRTGGTKLSVPPVILSGDYNKNEIILLSVCKHDFNAFYFSER